MKTCTTCKISQPLSNYTNNKHAGDGLSYYCKSCTQKKRYQTREHHIAYLKEYNIKNKDHLIQQRLEYAQNNREQLLLSSSKRRAKIDNIEHTITLEDIIIPDECPYLEVPLTTTQGQGYTSTNASLDRIDNTKGYIKGNVQVVSCMANTMKNHATEEQLITFAKSVLSMEEA